MLVVGLVHEGEWWPPDDVPSPGPGRSWSVPWGVLAWVAVVSVLLFLAPVAGQALGGLAGYGVILLAIGLGLWRVEGWCARQNWRGLRDYQA